MNRRIVTVAVLSLALPLSFATQAMGATGNVTITAAVNSKITVTAAANHSFGAFEPDAANPAPYVTAVNVRSNVPYTLSRSFTADTFLPGMLTINTPAGMDGTTLNPKAPGTGGFDWPQTYTLNLRPNGGEWSDPGSYSADVLYTALP